MFVGDDTVPMCRAEQLLSAPPHQGKQCRAQLRRTGEAMLNDRDNFAGADAALLIARIALAAIFLYSGYGKLTNPAGFSTYLVNHGFPGAVSYPLALVAGAIEALGGLA